MNAVERNRLQSMLNELNITQKQSVLSDDNTLQILAGPGSGKTKVLTCRVAYFVLEKEINPKNIVVVTFTNKAANEMKKRLSHLIGEKKSSELMIGTFHAICCKILRQYAKMVDLDANFTVADNELSKSIITTLRKDPNVKIGHFTRSQMKVGAIWGIINKAKNVGETCDIYARKYGNEFKTRDIATIYTLYEAELKKLNLVDFDNLIIKACELLRKNSYVLANVEAILVDEFQDTNSVQYDLIKLMTMQDNNKSVTIVGDPDQSIYGFRSAEPRNFIKMQNEFSNTGVINMEQNYRSTRSILKAALHVIGHDKSRIGKSLHTDNPVGKPIIQIEKSDESAQAQFVANEIQNIIKGAKGLVNFRDFAVLMRTNATSQQFEQIFRAHKIPFIIFGGDRFFNRVEVKDVLAYLNFAYNPKDSLSFNRIINVPKRGIGEINLEKILKKNEADKTDLLDTIMDIGMNKSSSFSNSIKNSMLELGNICLTAKKMMDDEENVPNIIRYILTEIKYLDYLKEHYFQDHESRWTNIGELISIAQQQPSLEKDVTDSRLDSGSTLTIDLTDLSSDDETIDSAVYSIQPVSIIETDSNLSERSDKTQTEVVPPLISISDFLEYCTLCSDHKESEESEGGKVVIATLHSSKGLEWPIVFIATCNEGVIPHQMSDSVDEECRLLYVGMTRSKFLLYCLSPKERISWGGTVRESPSHFLSSMDDTIYVTKPHVWDNDMRLMLSQTIGKDYIGESTKRLSETEWADAKKQRCE